MKLATYRDGSRDGQLVVVSRDLASAHFASGIAGRLQQVLDDWNFLSPQLEDLSTALNQGKARHAFAFDPAMCMAPLPRAPQRAQMAAYLPQVERLHAAAGLALPGHLRSEPLAAQAASDDLHGPTDDAPAATADDGLDFGAELAAITGEIPRGAAPAQALEGVRLLMLANDWTLRERAAAEQAKGLGLWHSKPGAAFSPVAVTPDELGEAWQGGRVHLTLQVGCSGRKVGLLDAAADMHFHFGQLLAHLARTRRLRPGCIVGTGPVSNQDAARGWACVAGKRALELAGHGEARTPWLQPGDSVRIEMKGRDGHSLFGAIEQTVGDPA